jgi:hypothetical protein
MSDMANKTNTTKQLQNGTDPGQDLPTMPDPGKSNPENGPHLPSMPDPANDPKNGQRLPAEPDPSRRPVPIDDPSLGDEISHLKISTM